MNFGYSINIEDKYGNKLKMSRNNDDIEMIVVTSVKTKDTTKDTSIKNKVKFQMNYCLYDKITTLKILEKRK